MPGTETSATMTFHEERHNMEAPQPENGSPGKGEPLVGEQTLWWTLAGLLIGAATGWFVGLAFGYGRLPLAGLAPIAAGGAGVSGFVSASVFGSMFGLGGGLLGTLAEARRSAHGAIRHGPGSEREKHRGSSFLQRLPVYGSGALALVMAGTLYVIASRAIGSGEPSDQSSRVTWNQKNATRVGGTDDRETAQYVLQIAYPATRAENRPGSIINVPDDWRIALSVTPLIARPISGALIVRGDAGATRELERLRAPSSISVGGAGSTGAEELTPANDVATIAAAVDERRAQAAGGVSTNVIVVNADADYRWALPAGAYAARTGTPILFVAGNDIPAPTAAALQRRRAQARVFALGPTDAIPQRLVDQLKSFGAVTRIEGSDFFTNAVRFAEFRDDNADFGWGQTGRGARRRAAANAILVNPERWQDGVFAAHLARGGKSGPLLLTGRDRLPAVVDNHFWRQRPVFASTPAEGPFNHVWVVGSFDRISYNTQAWADYSQEIEQYMTLSDSAVSGYEALGIAWMALSTACAIWIAFHSSKRLPDVMPVMKAAWAIFALLLGPVAAGLYVASYHGRPKMKHDDMVMWHRPLWLQTVSATVMMFAFDMMLMCLAVFAVAYYGFPIVRFNGPLYWIGSSMFLMMLLMYVITLVLMMLVFHTPMTMHERKIASYWKALVAGLPIMVATMTVESAGMMPTMWWQQMIFLPAMQMPTSDDFTMWTTLLFSAFVGFLTVLPFNYWLVRRGAKMGTM